MRLIEDAKRCWRMLSMQAMAAAVALQGAWAAAPDDMKATIPHQWVSWATMALLALGMLGRLVKQLPDEPKQEDKP